jgi:DNA invertase Pin-like site-specific DNA recombinase
MTAAIYARVSTKKVKCLDCGHQWQLPATATGQELACPKCDSLNVEQSQDTDNQVHELREYCARKGWTVTKEYIDHETGKHSKRDGFQSLFSDASKRLFDVVVVWALDRFTREGVLETFVHVRRLTLCGIEFESYTEQHFRTTGPAGELMLAIAAWIAKQERLRISERTKAGVARAKREGKHCGRPTRVFRRDRVVEMRAAGRSWRHIAWELKLPLTTVRDSVRKAS